MAFADKKLFCVPSPHRGIIAVQKEKNGRPPSAAYKRISSAFFRHFGAMFTQQQISGYEFEDVC